MTPITVEYREDWRTNGWTQKGWGICRGDYSICHVGTKEEAENRALCVNQFEAGDHGPYVRTTPGASDSPGLITELLSFLPNGVPWEGVAPSFPKTSGNSLWHFFFGAWQRD